MPNKQIISLNITPHGRILLPDGNFINVNEKEALDIAKQCISVLEKIHKKKKKQALESENFNLYETVKKGAGYVSLPL